MNDKCKNPTRAEVSGSEDEAQVSHCADDHKSTNPPAELEVYPDSISRAMLDLVKCKAARREEVDIVHGFGVYRKMPRAGAVGGQFVTVTRTDVKKGDEQRGQSTGAALVARELAVWNATMSGTFAATPPLECLKVLLSNIRTERRISTRMLSAMLSSSKSSKHRKTMTVSS